MIDESIGGPVDIRVVRLAGGDAHRWLDPALNVYTTAMDYPRGMEGQRRALWRDHIARPGWSAVGAVAAVNPPSGSRRRRTTTHSVRQRWLGQATDTARDEVLVGIAYGYRGASDQWWNQQLRRGLRVAGYTADRTTALLDNYFELTELHVHPDAQGRGLGEALLTTLLIDRPEARVLLSTPEVTAEANRAWALYRRLGFADVLRHYTFAGDPRPFAFLGRELPLHTVSGDAQESLPTGHQRIWHD